MHDIRFIRDNPDAFDAGLARRGLAPQAQALAGLDKTRREALTRRQELETERNAKSKQIGKAKASGDEAEFQRLRGEVERLKSEMEAADEAARAADEALNAELAALPNLPLDDVPEGEDESGNEEVRGWGEPKSYDFEVKDHVALGEGLGGLDFVRRALRGALRSAGAAGTRACRFHAGRAHARARLPRDQPTLHGAR